MKWNLHNPAQSASEQRRRRRRNGNVVNDDEDGVNGIVTIEAVEVAPGNDARFDYMIRIDQSII